MKLYKNKWDGNNIDTALNFWTVFIHFCFFGILLVFIISQISHARLLRGKGNII